MKNRKKGDAEPKNPSLAAKKKLMKLKNISKVDKPIVVEIKRKAQEVIDSPKNSNNIVELLGYLEATEPSYTVIAAINGLKRIFVGLLEKGAVQKKATEESPATAEDKYKSWVCERYEEYVRKLAAVCHHAKSSVVSLAVAGLFSLVSARHKAAAPPAGLAVWSEDEVKVLHTLVLCLCSTKTSTKSLLSKFQEYLDYMDVKFYTLERLSKVVSMAIKTQKATPVFLDNVMNTLEVLDMTKKPEKVESTLLCHNSEGRVVFQLDYGLAQRHFGSVWISFLKSKLSVGLYKRVLVIIHDKVLPHLPNPLLLTDFLLSSYEVGGSISLLALSGVFTLVQEYNLEYPDFYKKLYALLTVEVLHVKYRARFFHLTDMFLMSTHLPQYLVAAFVKRLARISLQGPAVSLPTCLYLIQNLLHRHKGLQTLINNPAGYNLTTDPYLAEEPDPALCKAVDSSLWEVKTLTDHVLPQVSSVAKQLIEKEVRDAAGDFRDSLDNSWAHMMEAELKRKVWVNVPINWEKPEGLNSLKEDVVSEIFSLA